MRILRATLISTCAYILASALPNAARAEQAFVCENGRIVYATMRTLEDLKKTDACIAKYFGLTITKPAAPTIPLPVRKPNLVQLPLKPSTISSGTSFSIEEEKSAVLNTLQVPNALRQPTKSEEPIDFRNIPIINAKPGTKPIFLHKH